MSTRPIGELGATIRDRLENPTVGPQLNEAIGALADLMGRARQAEGIDALVAPTRWKIVVKREDHNEFSARILGDPGSGEYQTELHPLGIIEKTPTRAVRKALDHLPAWTKIEVVLLGVAS